MQAGSTTPMVPSRSGRATMKVRFFRDEELDGLQEEINRWLGERPDREIVEIRQSVVPAAEAREFVVSVWYVEY